DEETAVEVMRAGAADFVLKGKPARLPAAVLREMRERENRRRHRQDEISLASSQARLAAQHAVASALAESNTLLEASSGILESLSVELGWVSAALWLVDRE